MFISTGICPDAIRKLWMFVSFIILKGSILPVTTGKVICFLLYFTFIVIPVKDGIFLKYTCAC